VVTGDYNPLQGVRMDRVITVVLYMSLCLLTWYSSEIGALLVHLIAGVPDVLELKVRFTCKTNICMQ